MDLDQMRQLVAIAETGTMSAAAERYSLTQPSLSRSMRRLEAELGCELFARTRNRATLNEAGMLAVEAAREVLAAETRLRDGLDELARRARTLRVASVAPAPVWDLAARVTAALPGTILDTENLPDAEVERRLFAGTADLAVTRRPIALPNCTCSPLMTESLAVAAPEGHPLAERAHVSFADLAGESFIVLEDIGFWKEVYEQRIPDANVILQRDREVFWQLAQSTDLLHFTTDAPQNRMQDPRRRVVPISDASAHVTFYLATLANAPERVRDIARLMGGNAACR